MTDCWSIFLCRELGSSICLAKQRSSSDEEAEENYHQVVVSDVIQLVPDDQPEIQTGTERTWLLLIGSFSLHICAAVYQEATRMHLCSDERSLLIGCYGLLCFALRNKLHCSKGLTVVVYMFLIGNPMTSDIV